jgi:hypothetical protein
MNVSQKSSETLFSRDWYKDGSIIKLHDRDDVDHMPTWKRYLFNMTPFMVLLSLGSYWTYFVFRIYCVISAQKAQKQAYPMAWIFIAIELSVAIPTFLHLFMTMFILNPRRRPKLRLTGDDVPSVDVFITCCKEETDLVLDTTRAACEVDYPRDRFRVVVLDDGRDADLMDECEMMRQSAYPNLYYMCREKIPGKPHHFKAGNLNYGFDEVAKLPGGAAPFAAALDADMIPEKHWLRAIMPHMLIDERMALACPPQVSFGTFGRSFLICNSSFTMFPRMILFLKVWTFSSTFWKESRMLSVLLGVLVQDIFFVVRHWKRLVGFLSDLLLKMLPLLHSCLERDGRLLSFTNLYNSVLCLTALEVI